MTCLCLSVILDECGHDRSTLRLRALPGSPPGRGSTCAAAPARAAPGSSVPGGTNTRSDERDQVREVREAKKRAVLGLNTTEPISLEWFSQGSMYIYIYMYISLFHTWSVATTVALWSILMDPVHVDSLSLGSTACGFGAGSSASTERIAHAGGDLGGQSHVRKARCFFYAKQRLSH